MLLADTSRFEKKKVQFTFQYYKDIKVHMVSVSGMYLLKALVKQGGYSKVPPSHYLFFFKAQLGNF